MAISVLDWATRVIGSMALDERGIYAFSVAHPLLILARAYWSRMSLAALTGLLHDAVLLDLVVWFSANSRPLPNPPPLRKGGDQNASI